jgi:tetratricopeptide (TPR) repeat protein
MKKICILSLSLLLVGMFGCGSGSLPKETVQQVSDILEEAVEVTQSADPDVYKVHQVHNLTYIATLYEKASLHEQGAELIPFAIQLTRETQHNPNVEKGDSMIINALIDIARADHSLGNSKEADTLLNEALSMAQSYEDDLDRASELSGVAKAYAQIGMEDKCRQILSLFEETVNAAVSEKSFPRVIAMLNIAEIYNELGEEDKAWDELSQLSSWIETLDPDDMLDMFIILSAEVFMGSAYTDFGPYAKALEVTKENVYHLLKLADRDREDGNTEREQARLDDALSLAKTQENNLVKADHLHHIAIYYAKTGRSDMVGPLRDQAETAIANATEKDWEDYLVGSPNASRALLAAHLGEYDKALELARTLYYTGPRGKAIADIASIIIEKAKGK